MALERKSKAGPFFFKPGVEKRYLLGRLVRGDTVLSREKRIPRGNCQDISNGNIWKIDEKKTRNDLIDAFSHLSAVLFSCVS